MSRPESTLDPGPCTNVTDDELLEAVDRLADCDGGATGDGGVTPEQVAAELDNPIKTNTMSDRLRDLAKNGDLQRAWTTTTDGGRWKQRRVYSPADAESNGGDA